MEQSQFKTELIDIENVKENVVRQSEYLNSILGILAFTLGLTCLSFPEPKYAAYTCLGIIIPIYFKAINMTHPDLYALRKLVKETQDKHGLELLKYLDSNYIGARVFLTKNVVFWYGFAFFLIVLINPDWLFWLRP